MSGILEPNRKRQEAATYEVPWGSNIVEVIADAINKAKNFEYDAAVDHRNLKEHEIVSFDFNGVRVRVNGLSDPEHILRDWNRAMSGYIPKDVGPSPKPELSKEELESDRLIEAQNERARAVRRAEAYAEAKAKREEFNERMKDALEMKSKDEDGWNAFKNSVTDPYTAAALEYAEGWARLMQLEMEAGKSIAEIARPTSHEADIQGITGFMYGIAVSVLSQFWEHGEELRQWHNLDTQIGNEGEKANKGGGVLNPALISIGR